SSDYALSAYSLDDTPGDYALAHFSIDRDKQLLIPYIKAAQALQPGLKVWGVPWSPPGWMKTNNGLVGGRIKADGQTMTALALYFEKYVQAYQADGVHLFMIMPQNEPTISSNYSSCRWTGDELANFIKNYLGPKFAADSVPCEIWLGTLQNSDYTYVAPSVDDGATLAIIKGIGFQWGGSKSCALVHQEHPEEKLMQSETECGNHENDWHYAEKQYDLIKNYIEAGVSSYMLWNMVLDETGKSWAGWAQCSPVVVDTETKKVTYTPQFYAFKHFSYYVQPGATRVFTSGSYGDQIGFINPNGDIVIVLKNGTNDAVPVAIEFDGQKVKPTLPAHSFNTLVIHATS
ncbi:MAG: glycoside hydrolase family 30 beta sandwich domain-containing protein, partial [Opitutales bacterium]